MGGQDSKPKEEDYFILEHISKMTTKIKKVVSYYLIHQKDASIDPLLKSLREYFKIDYFPQVKTLRQEMSFVNKNEVVKVVASAALTAQDFQYLQNENKIYQIVLFGNNTGLKKNYPKIVAEVDNKDNIIATLNNLEEKDSLEMPSENILLVDQDTKLLNKYRLNYQCNITYFERNKAKQDFIKLAKHLHPDKNQQIEEFQKNYDLAKEGQEKWKMIVQWILKDSFYWQMINSFTRNTTDPKRLAYVRLGIKDTFQTIKSMFAQKKVYKQLYIVVDVNQDEKAKLEKSQGHCILFTSFVKGYVKEKDANEAIKLRPNAFKFTVMPNRGKLQAELDFGYIVDDRAGENVIYNIFNVFRIDQINTKTQRGTILYGALPMNFCHRQIKKEQRPKMSRYEEDLMRNYDYLQDLIIKIDSQATILQLSGYHSEGLEIYDKKVNFIRKTHQSDESMDKCIIQKGDALRISGDFDSSEKEYQSIFSKSDKMKLISQIHLAQLYLHKGQQQKFQKLIQEIAPKFTILQKDEKEQYFKAKNFEIVRTMKKGSLKKAQKMLNELQTQVSTHYSESMEGKPIVHDIYRSIATCKSKLGLHNQALGLLKNTLSWQLVCEGKTSNVALTQTLIQSVSRSSGNTTELQQSITRLSQMSQQIYSSQSHTQSALAVDLNKSLINIKVQ